VWDHKWEGRSGQSEEIVTEMCSGVITSSMSTDDVVFVELASSSPGPSFLLFTLFLSLD
jgi:hypothetical protein